MPRGRRAALILATAFIAAILLALIAEAGVRVRHWVKYGYVWGIQSTYETDAETGLRIPIPGLKTDSITINSLGYRSPEIAMEKLDGLLRIAFLGGSTTYCAEVSGDDQTWPHLVWRGLSDSFPDKKFDYANAGIPGYSAALSLQNLERRVADLNPDVIVIYHATNDLSANSYVMAKSMDLVDGKTDEQLFWLSRYSLLSYLVDINARLLWRQRQARQSTGKLEFSTEEITQDFHNDLTALVLRSREVAPLVVLVTFSTRLRQDQTFEQQLQAAETSLYYMPYMSVDGLLRAFEAYNDAIKEVAQETGAMLIDAAHMIPGDAEHFADSAHFADAGAASMASVVVAELAGSTEFQRLLACEGCAEPD